MGESGSRGLSKPRTYKEAHMERLGSVQGLRKREKRERVKKCERPEIWRGGDRDREKTHKRRGERRERKGLAAMRADIVTEAVQSKRGQEGEKKQKVKR